MKEESMSVRFLQRSMGDKIYLYCSFTETDKAKFKDPPSKPVCFDNEREMRAAFDENDVTVGTAHLQERFIALATFDGLSGLGFKFER